MEWLAIILGPVSGGIMLDLIFNGGDGISSIVSAIRGSKSDPDSDKIELIEDLVEKLDLLYEDLEYENSEEEIATIKSKIELRQKLLKSLTDKH